MTWELYKPEQPPIDPSQLTRLTNDLAVWLPSNHSADFMKNWDDNLWKAATWVTYWQCALPWFVDRLRATDAPVPPAIWKTLQNIATESRERTKLMLDASVELLTALDIEGIAALPLKGATLAPVYYNDPLRRPLGDLDILVHKTDLTGGIAVLQRLGYRYFSESAEDVVYLRGERKSNMWAPDNVHPVELHFTLREEYAGLHYNLADIMWENASRQLYWQGSEVWLPDTISLLQHICAHATSDWLIHRGRLMHLDDILTISAKLSPADWDTFLMRIGNTNSRFIYPIFAFAKRYANPPIPDSVLETLQKHIPEALCHWCTYTELADTSLSNPSSRSGLGLDMADLLALNTREHLKMWLRSVFPLRWNLMKRYPRLAKSPFWLLCYVLLNLDRIKHMAYKMLKRE